MKIKIKGDLLFLLSRSIFEKFRKLQNKNKELNLQAPFAQKLANEVVFQRFQGEWVEFFKSDLTDLPPPQIFDAHGVSKFYFQCKVRIVFEPDPKFEFFFQKKKLPTTFPRPRFRSLNFGNDPLVFLNKKSSCEN